jgi:NAD(P)-dependent dehydrogenase (short-subunit alcohol dehydrogenase family)
MVTIITGGASGIGLATAARIRAGGGRVALLDIDFDRCRSAAQTLGEDVVALKVDVVDERSLLEAADQVESVCGPVGGLVCGAGAPQVPGKAEDIDIADWDSVVSSHLKGTFLTCRVFGGKMIAHKKGGAVVNIASVTGYCPGPTYAYAPAKAAIINMTSILAVEWARQGVRVNAVAPGWTDTPFLTRRIVSEKPRDMSALASASLLGQLLQPEQIAEVIHFLLSPQSSAIVGCTLPCDGGYLASRGWGPYGGVPQA